MKPYLQDTFDRLTEITEGCREDMHEPDEQGLTAYIYGHKLDNANGDRPAILSINNVPVPGSGEIVIAIEREPHQGDVRVQWFNLATLIALARKANLEPEIMKPGGLRDTYISEFEVIDGLNQHPSGMNFEDWKMNA